MKENAVEEVCPISTPLSPGFDGSGLGHFGPGSAGLGNVVHGSVGPGSARSVGPGSAGIGSVAPALVGHGSAVETH